MTAKPSHRPATLLALALVAAIVAPLVPLAVWSVSHRWYFPALLPTEWSLRAWRYVALPQSRVAASLATSAAVALAVTGLSLLLALPAGRALGLRRFRGKTLVEFLVLAPTIVPTIAVAMGIHGLFIRYGLADTLLGVVLVHLVPVTPYTVLLLSSVFARYDADFEAQARTLGATPRQVWQHVTLPAILPGVAVAAFFAFIISWSQYLLTLLIGGGRVQTLPLLLFSFATSGDNAVTAALSLVFVAPALAFVALVARFLSGEAGALGAGMP